MNCILVLCGSHLQEFFPVKEGFMKLGRESDNDVQLLDDTVSRHHADLSNMPNACELRDNNSANGTFLNGIKIQSTLLRDGDEIRLGSTVLRFETVEHEMIDDIGVSRDYSSLSQSSTVRVKKHPDDKGSEAGKKETSQITIPPITIKRKED